MLQCQCQRRLLWHFNHPTCTRETRSRRVRHQRGIHWCHTTPGRSCLVQQLERRHLECGFAHSNMPYLSATKKKKNKKTLTAWIRVSGNQRTSRRVRPSPNTRELGLSPAWRHRTVSLFPLRSDSVSIGGSLSIKPVVDLKHFPACPTRPRTGPNSSPMSPLVGLPSRAM